MHEKYHVGSAILFAAVGQYHIALGCILPDISWIKNEIDFRRSKYTNWHDWSKTLTEKDVIPYRIAHSVLLWGIFGLLTGYWYIVLGVLVHIAMDLPTHAGIMTQVPLYPFKWKWKWIIKH